MRITLNLASRPFIELRPLYARLTWWMTLLVITAIPLAFLLHVELRRASIAQAEHNALTRNMQKLRQEQQNNQAQMRQPQNAAVLAQSEFLNQLYKRKAFSWTAVMMDLETVLPAGVQVTNLEPVTTPDGHVTIRMRVNGPRDRAVELIRNLEHSHRFLAVRLAGESAETAGSASQAVMQPVSESSSVNFDILADYNPLPRDATTKTKTDSPEDAADKPAKPVKHSTAPPKQQPLSARPTKAGAR
jgi:type IV pilus assembly protein PilN